MKPRSTTPVFGIALAVSVSSILVAPSIRAESNSDSDRKSGSKTTLSGDLEYAQSAGSGIGGGWGFGIRLGQRLHVPLVALDPEIGFTYHNFGDAPSPAMYRGIAGLRLGLAEIIRPGIYGHVGIGHLSIDVPDASHTAFTYDVGLFIDLTLLPLLDIGVHASYDAIAGGDNIDAVKWVTLGGHLGLVF